MTSDSSRLDGMDASAKRELLARLLRERATGAGEEFELSPGQEALWFLHELAPDSAAYNVAFCARVRSELDRERLERALLKLMERHSMLRCIIVKSAQAPRQRIGPVPERCLEIVDASGLEEEELKSLVDETNARPFDLAAGPVFRCTLFSCSPTEHVLLLSVHHVFSDASSFGTLVSDLTTLYEEDSPTLTPLAADAYAGFVKWIRAKVDSEEGLQAWKYWQAQLQNLPSERLPSDHPRPKMQSFRGASHHFELPAALCEAVRTLARSLNATPFMVLAAGLHALLHRYSGSPVVPIGTPLSGRSRPEDEATVGYFINPVVLYAPVRPGMTFRQHITEMRATAIGAQRFGEFPFPELVKRLQPVRDTSEMPVFQVMLNMNKASQFAAFSEVARRGVPVRVGSLVLETFPVDQQEGQFDLHLDLLESGGAIPAVFKYRTDLFEQATIERMAGHFRTLLESGVTDPDQRLNELPLLTKAERRQLVVDWNATEVKYPADVCLHALFEAQARRMPEAVAVEFEGSRLRYRELNERANRLAHYLRGIGVGPDTLVGVAMERSLELVAALVGVLKAGGAYVPMDPGYPKERLGCILEDSKAPLVLTEESLVNELPRFAGRLLCVDKEWSRITRESAENPASEVKPEHLAYVLFTSGSTGRPKGVAIEHRAAANFVQWAKRVFTPPELAGVLFATSVCFDLSVFEVFVPLSVGGKVIVVPNVLHLPFLPERDELTLINTVPSAMAELLRGGAVPASVKTVNLAGEVLPESLVEQIYATTQAEKVYNLYGPTEATTYSTYTLVQRGSSVAIGKPIANTQCFILDAHRYPVPIGVSGELYLSGQGLARGYYGRPELTNERFVPNPFGEDEGARMYRTGDLCRWLHDGSIQYLGRIDNQIKLRGFRIELGEIENALRQHPEVQEAVVVVREEGEKRLVAYVVLGGEPSCPTAELRGYLKQKLPEYMLPAAYVRLKALPLTPNGKLDRKALPAPEGNAYTHRGYEAPQGETETLLADLWGEVLKLDRVGRHDNFFEMGGHSLLAMQLVSRIRGVLGVDVALGSLFETPTVAGVTEYIQAIQWTAEKSSASGLALLADREEVEL